MRFPIPEAAASRRPSDAFPPAAFAGHPLSLAARAFFFLIVAAFLAIALLPAFAPAATEPSPAEPPQAAPTRPEKLTVVVDKDYPPYIITTPSGEVRGILVDRWKLWEKRTGVPVTLVPMNWDAAQNAMRHGEADVIDLFFENETRQKDFLFSKPYATIDVPVFVQKDLSGITDMASLRGFPVAVKRGDACAEILQRHGIGPLLYYDTYEDVIQAAKNGNIKVFCMDAPPAMYHLYRQGLDGEFRLAFILYSGKLHTAVRKGNAALLRFVEAGFDGIAAKDLKAIDKKWRGTPLFPSSGLRYALLAVAALAAAALVLLSINALLRRTVRRQTARLEELLEAVGQSERRYRELVENAACLIVRLDLLGRVVFCNAWGQRVFGLPLERMLGRDIDALGGAPGSDASESWGAILAVLAEAPDGARTLDRRHIGENGRAIWITWSVIALRDPKGLPTEFLCVGNEITQRKQAEKALAASEARYALVVRASNDGIWDWDLRTDAVYFSPRYLEILGLAPDALSPTVTEWNQRIHPDDVEAVLRENRRCATGETDSFVVEYRMRHADGSYRWIVGRGANSKDEKGQVVRMAGSHTDITRRKRDETALRESQDQLAKIFRLSPVGLCVSAQRDSRVVDINENGARMFGYEKAAVIGRESLHLGVWPHPEDRRALVDELVAKGSIVGKELELLHQNGSTVVVLYSAVPIQAYGETCLLSVLVDITERKAIERSLRRAKEAAEAANRAKTEFLSTMSHEIRTPMNTILGMAQALSAADLPPKQTQAIRAIEIAGGSLLTLLNDILDLSQIESGGLIIEEKPCDIGKLAGRIVDMMRPDAAAKDIALRLDLAEDLPPSVSLSPDRIRQVLVNLLGNAVKFTHQGSIVLAVGREAGPTGGDWLRLDVRDTGIGIPVDKLPVIFDRFTQADATTSRLYGGVGLGLAISKKLVDLMGGSIRVETAVGQGSTFTVRLPLRPVHTPVPQDALPHAAKPTVISHPGRRATVLLIEDSPGNAEVTRIMLEDSRFDLTWAPSGQAGLEALRETPYDIVLMDMEMPEMDGLETTRALRRMETELGRPRTPVIALTAHAFEEHRQRGLAAGCDDFQAKPVAKTRLLDALETWMAVAGN
ncbi:multi-sensor hybrid histidine kinase [Solidesulfovibrio fructosivorans JJ]]|uniref:Sensory/regulatory protein RpfC n=1 Tax=Solidesulfovibrio fructosivorans JJ] TaxID=596151 RepID=E1JZW6_SOLFR|nr:PAS domain S-box protein [Solidesulfovibrio fructosivorans]EFL50061.1 multi-sensor hybrid histidine kinase [Solidesulfovibrio fructosivorans JJ]]